MDVYCKFFISSFEIGRVVDNIVQCVQCGMYTRADTLWAYCLQVIYNTISFQYYKEEENHVKLHLNSCLFFAGA